MSYYALVFYNQCNTFKSEFILFLIYGLFNETHELLFCGLVLRGPKLYFKQKMILTYSLDFGLKNKNMKVIMECR